MTPQQAAIAANPPDKTSDPTPRNLGAVFTRRWVVDLVLDLCGYTSDQPLFDKHAIEPSCGEGAFLTAMVRRLIESCDAHDVPIAHAANAISAFDIDPDAVDRSRSNVQTVLIEAGTDPAQAEALSTTWINEGDFLLTAPRLPQADWVIGNPPYLRIEDVSRELMASYRRAWPTMSGRADVYVGFYEAGLDRLKPAGRLAYICADRWMRNRYGAGLRTIIEARFAMDACVVMHDVDAFENRVSAYPAINVVRNGVPDSTLLVDATANLDQHSAHRLVRAWQRGASPTTAVEPAFRASWVKQWHTGGQSWPSGSPESLALLDDLETRFPTMAESGVRITVGVATGAESVYIVDDPEGIEPTRLLPTISAKETTLGGIDWRGRYLVNPWDDEGLVDLGRYPLLAAHFETNRKTLENRHVGKRNPTKWWRTIDRIHPEAATTPKLLIPDLKDRIHPVLDQGRFIPLHNLYYATSDVWDLAVLGGLLISDFANLFVESYSVRMANGYMRVSAQYLRRVRIPHYDQVDETTRKQLRAAFWKRDVMAANSAAIAAYDLEPSALHDGRIVGHAYNDLVGP